VENADFFIPLPFNLHDHLEPLDFFPKILIQTAQVPKLLDDAKHCQNVQPLGRAQLTSDRFVTT